MRVAGSPSLEPIDVPATAFQAVPVAWAFTGDGRLRKLVPASPARRRGSVDRERRVLVGEKRGIGPEAGRHPDRAGGEVQHAERPLAGEQHREERDEPDDIGDQVDDVEERSGR